VNLLNPCRLLGLLVRKLLGLHHRHSSPLGFVSLSLSILHERPRLRLEPDSFSLVPGGASCFGFRSGLLGTR
jgi:hypothetical protein